MASPVDTSVKFLNARAPGAPEFAAGAGSLIPLLDAFLVNGYGLKAVDTAVIASGICTLNFSSGEGPYEENTVILVEGATPAGLNGEQKLKAVTSSSVSFATDLPDGAVTGAITFKCAPCGWEKVFSKTNVAVYRSADLSTARPYLRVDASHAAFARVMMYETMSGVDSGGLSIPLSATVNGGYFWHYGSHAAKDYFLAGDSAGFYFCPTSSSAQNKDASENYAAFSYFAGSFNSFRSGDFYACALTGALTAAASTSHGDVFAFSGDAAGVNYTSVLRQFSGFGAGHVAGRWFGIAGNNSAAGSNTSPLGPVTSSADNAARFTPVYISAGPAAVSAAGVRGVFPGVLAPMNSGVLSVLPFVKVQVKGRGLLGGKVFYTIPAGITGGDTSGSGGSGLGFIDITGPWR